MPKKKSKLDDLPLYEQLVRKNFIRLRKENKLTQAQLAEKSGDSTSYIGQIEGGHGSFSSEAQQKFADIFGVDRVEFVRPEGYDEIKEIIPIFSEAGLLHEPEQLKQILAPQLRNPKLSNLVRKTIHILTSNTQYAGALESNIDAFYNAVLLELEGKERAKLGSQGYRSPEENGPRTNSSGG